VCSLSRCRLPSSFLCWISSDYTAPPTAREPGLSPLNPASHMDRDVEPREAVLVVRLGTVYSTFACKASKTKSTRLHCWIQAVPVPLSVGDNHSSAWHLSEALALFIRPHAPASSSGARLLRKPD
jgi:hypothetical protein